MSNVLKNKRFSNYSNPVFTLGKILQGKSPIVFNCWDAAARQVKYGGNYETSTSDRVNMSGLESQKNLKIDVQKGVDLIISNLNEGKSVVAGIDYGPNQEGVNNSNESTDHFVNIVGYGKDKKGYFFSYYDNAIEGGEKEGINIEKNKFYYDAKTNRFIDDKAIHGKEAVLSEVRGTRSRPAPTLKTNNSYRQYP